MVEVLGQLPPGGQGRPPRAVETHQRYDCEGRRFDVRFSEQEVDGERMREVRLHEIGTPNGSLPQPELDAVQAVLDPYWLMFSAPLTCRGEDFTIWFEGRRRDQAENSHVRVSGNGLEVRNIQESGVSPLPITTHQRLACDGRRLDVRFSERAAGGDGGREVRVLAITAPAGPLSQHEVDEVQSALNPFWSISLLALECSGDDFAMRFEGLRRGQDRTSSIRVSGSGLRVTHIAH